MEALNYKHLLFLFLWIITNNFTLAQINFNEVGIDSISSKVSTLEYNNVQFHFLDTNSDSYTDLVLNDGINTLLFVNDGNGNFSFSKQLDIVGRIRKLVDYDFDNDIDIVSLEDNIDQLRVYLNNGTNTFIESNIIESEASACGFGCFDSIDFGDANNDGYMDVISSSFIETIDESYTNEQYLLNNGNNSFIFSNDLISSFETGHLGVKFIDIDGDDDLDIFTNGTSIDGIAGYNPLNIFYINDGNGNYDTSIENALPKLTSVKFEDFNNDNLADAFDGENVFLNEGTGNFTSNSVYSINENESSIYFNIADFNNDSYADILINAGIYNYHENNWENQHTKIFLNNHGRSFTEIENIPFENVHIYDFDITNINNNDTNEILIFGRDTLNNQFFKMYSIDMVPCSTDDHIINIAECDSYTWTLTNETYSVSGQYPANIFSSSGCDSLITLDLTIHSSFSSTEVIEECTSYFWPTSGNTYTESGIFSNSFTNAQGCDSTRILDLTIHNNSIDTLVITECQNYTWPVNQKTYTKSGIYSASFTTTAGCDSIKTLDLTIQSIDLSISVENDLLISHEQDAKYQWLDCNNGYAILEGENAATIKVNEDSYYALKLTKNNCIDTTTCKQAVVTSLNPSPIESNYIIYPNPIEDQLNIDFETNQDFICVTVYNIEKQLINESFYTNTKQLQLEIMESPGVYLIVLKLSSDEVLNFKVIKN
ncbi:MAG: T9SS type A sorting domain-containing protein [Bacteroidota bacterium]